MPCHSSPLFQRLAGVLLTAIVAAAAVVGCGGGVGSGGTGVYASGPISGFGSIIVNEVRYEESGATIVDDDDASRDRSELKLGMTVSIDADAISADTSGRAAVARHVRVGSEIVGPVSAIDAAAGTLTILGQTVAVAVDTVFDERIAGGLAGLRVGDSVEVYALYDVAGVRYKATRIEPRAALAEWLLRGPVAALDTRERTLSIGAATLLYANATNVPADLGVGQIVRLRLATNVDALGSYAVTRFATASRTPDDRDTGEVEGLILSLSSSTNFSVGGLRIDASAAQFPDGSAGLRPGVRVKIRGSVAGGVLRAAVVEIEDDLKLNERGFELKGMIGTVNAAARTFTLRSQTISWARPDLQLEGGTLADLVPGRRVEVKARPGPERTVLEATRIKFE